MVAPLLVTASWAVPLPAGAAPGPAPGSGAYMARDLANMETAFGRDTVQLASPAYLAGLPPTLAWRWLAQISYQGAHPQDPSVTGGNLVPGWNAGNPDRAGWAGTRGRELAVHFTAADGAVLSGTLFAPLPGARDPYTHQPIGFPLPGVVITTGSIQASSGVYEWLAEDLAERGYLVLTFDVQGQGTSETFPHQGGDPARPGCGPTTQPDQETPCAGVPSEQQAGFDQDTEDAVTFLLSMPSHRYPDVASGAPTDALDPWWHLFDHSPDRHTVTPGRTTRVALIGHSTGAVTASYLQGLDPRLQVAVALDKITATKDSISDDQAELGSLPGPVVPKVPTLGMQSEYGFEPQPYWEAGCSSFEPCPAAAGGSPTTPPDLSRAPNPNREEDTGFDAWAAKGIDSMVIVPRASTHLDYTDEPPILPASVWGQAMASYYVQAWLDHYLRHDPKAGAALLSTNLHYLEPVGGGKWEPVTIPRNQDLSFYFCSGYRFHAGGRVVTDKDIVGDGCH
jgi:dienelactone hydrolase